MAGFIACLLAALARLLPAKPKPPAVGTYDDGSKYDDDGDTWS